MGLFSKTPEQKAEAAWKKRAKEKPKLCMEEAIEDNDYDHYRILLGKMDKLGKFETVKKIIECDAIDLLDHFLTSSHGFAALSDASKRKDMLVNLLVYASKYTADNCYEMLFEYAENFGDIHADLARKMIAKDLDRNLSALLYDMDQDELEAELTSFLSAAEKSSDDVVEVLLEHAARFPDTELGEHLLSACWDENISRVKMLLNAGATPEYNSYQPIAYAVSGQSEEILRLFRDKGFDFKGETFEKIGGLEDFARTDAQKTFVKQFMGMDDPVSDAEMSAGEIADDQTCVIPANLHSPAIDILEEVVTLHDGKKLTNVFNFVNQQQTVIVEKPNSSLMTATIENFDRLSPALLLRAEEMLVAMKRRSDQNKIIFFKKS